MYRFLNLLPDFAGVENKFYLFIFSAENNFFIYFSIENDIFDFLLALKILCLFFSIEKFIL
jgi:hypothetical protein